MEQEQHHSRYAREDLSGPALRAFFRLAELWGLSESDQKILLDVDDQIFCGWQQDTNTLVPPETLERISYLLGIFKALNTLYREEPADRWMLLPNSNRIFRGVTPIDYMKQGGTPAFSTVRRLLDAQLV